MRQRLKGRAPLQSTRKIGKRMADAELGPIDGAPVAGAQLGKSSPYSRGADSLLASSRARGVWHTHQ